MDQIAKLGTDISEIALPTIAIYGALQKARLDDIFANAPTEHRYGPHPRQKLDLYFPPDLASKANRLPCIIYLYGGGLIRGAKRLAPFQGAIYANVGKYLSEAGFVTIIPDYRLYGEEDGGKYPSGGEDVALTVDWVHQNISQADTQRIFLMGNSAGGVHIATYLWSSGVTTAAPHRGVRGAVLTQVPMHFRNAATSRASVLEGYFGGKDQVDQLSPYGLRKKSKDQTDILLLVADKDPEDEILGPNRDFVSLCQELRTAIPDQIPIQGHNHISPFPALGLGGNEDVWAEGMLRWITDRC